MHGPIWCIQQRGLQKSRGIRKGASPVVTYRKGEQRLGEGNTCQTTGSPCSKNNKTVFFWEKRRSSSIEAATWTEGTQRGGQEEPQHLQEESSPYSYPFSLPPAALSDSHQCRLGLGTTCSFQGSQQTMNFHQKTKLTFSNFLSGQREGNASPGGSASWVGVCYPLVSADPGQQFTSFGGSTLCWQLSGSVLAPRPAVRPALSRTAIHQFCLLQPLQIWESGEPS